MEIINLTKRVNRIPDKISDESFVTYVGFEALNDNFIILKFKTRDKYVEVFTGSGSNEGGSYTYIDFNDYREDNPDFTSISFNIHKDFTYTNVIALKHYYEIHLYNTNGNVYVKEVKNNESKE